MSVTFYGAQVLWDDPYDSNSVQLGALDLNICNANARMLIRWLGVDTDNSDGLCGKIDPHELKGRCVMALAVGGTFSDDGIAATQDGGPGTGHATFIDCGVRPGYFAEKAAILVDICDEAIEKELEVYWA
jgi:hypothetical protein